jgi:hypothetical protein
MSEYYDDIGQIQKYHPMPEDEVLCLPASVLRALPQRICNIPPDEIFYASDLTVILDATKQGAITIDTFDNAAPLPVRDPEIQTHAAVMPVVRVVGEQAIHGYLLDLRRVTSYKSRLTGLGDGVDSEKFRNFATQFGTTLPAGIIVYNAGASEYWGNPIFQEQAEKMMTRVDAYVDLVQQGIFYQPYRHLVPDISRPALGSSTVVESRGELVPLRDTIIDALPLTTPPNPPLSS